MTPIEREYVVSWTYKGTASAIVMAATKKEAVRKVRNSEGLDGMGTFGYEPLWSTIVVSDGTRALAPDETETPK